MNDGFSSLSLQKTERTTIHAQGRRIMRLGSQIIGQDTSQNDQHRCLGFEDLFGHDEGPHRSEDRNVHGWRFRHTNQKTLMMKKDSSRKRRQEPLLFLSEDVTSCCCCCSKEKEERRAKKFWRDRVVLLVVVMKGEVENEDRNNNKTPPLSRKGGSLSNSQQ